MENINDQRLLRKNSAVIKRAKLIVELDSVLQYEMFKCYFFAPLIFSLTYATIDATKGYKKGLFFCFAYLKIGIILVLF